MLKPVKNSIPFLFTYDIYIYYHNFTNLYKDLKLIYIVIKLIICVR